MRLTICAVAATVIAATINPAAAQTRQEKCRALAGPMLTASDSFGQLMGILRDLDFHSAGATLGGEEAAHFRRLAELRDTMIPHTDAFLDEIEATALAMRACGR